MHILLKCVSIDHPALRTKLFLLSSFTGSLLRRTLTATAKLIQFIQTPLLYLRRVLDRVILWYSLRVRVSNEEGFGKDDVRWVGIDEQKDEFVID